MTNMLEFEKELSLEQMREIQINILDYLCDFCKRNDIKWWIEFGTLLGAVRHKGFIPWDDDIDVAMLRKDYEVFRKNFNEASQTDVDGRYKLLDPESEKGYKYSFGKIIDLKTILYEGKKERIKIGVYIDVFVYDAAPDDKAEYAFMIKKRDALGKLRALKLFDLDKNNVSIKSVVAFVRKIVLAPLPMSVILNKMQKNAKKYDGVRTGKIADFLWPYGNFGFYLNDDFFDDQINLEFEGRFFPAPKKYDTWLRMTYGDYMKLPPVDQRVRHAVKAFLIKD